jgi:hypothetical protein
VEQGLDKLVKLTDISLFSNAIKEVEGEGQGDFTPAIRAGLKVLHSS